MNAQYFLNWRGSFTPMETYLVYVLTAANTTAAISDVNHRFKVSDPNHAGYVFTIADGDMMGRTVDVYIDGSYDVSVSYKKEDGTTFADTLEKGNFYNFIWNGTGYNKGTASGGGGISGNPFQVDDLTTTNGNVLTPPPIVHTSSDTDRTTVGQDIHHATGTIYWYNTNQIMNEFDVILDLGSGDIQGRLVQITGKQACTISFTDKTGTASTTDLKANQVLHFVWHGTGWIEVLGDITTVLDNMVIPVQS